MELVSSGLVYRRPYLQGYPQGAYQLDWRLLINLTDKRPADRVCNVPDYVSSAVLDLSF